MRLSKPIWPQERMYDRCSLTMHWLVNDIAVNNHRRSKHLDDLRIVFDIMQAHQLKMNLTKSFFRVSRGKFFGFIITTKGIHLDPDKVKAIQRMQSLRTLKELKDLQGILVYIWRFIVNLSGCCQPYTLLMKKVVSFIWDEAFQKAFEDIKEYLTKPPVLVAPILKKSFLLYVWAIDHSLGALLAQKND